jgi:hypothetical protein
MKRTDRLQRQSYGCGYEAPAPENIPVRVWPPPDGKYGFRHIDGAPLPDVCPGYLTSLPECLEVWHAHTHWEKAQLQLMHRKPTAALLTAIEILDGAIAGAKVWESAPREEG